MRGKGRTKPGRGGGRTPFNQRASQLRDTLENRLSAAQDDQPEGSQRHDGGSANQERHPHNLKGRAIGMFYARRQIKRAEESILVS